MVLRVFGEQKRRLGEQRGDKDQDFIFYGVHLSPNAPNTFLGKPGSRTAPVLSGFIKAEEAYLTFLTLLTPPESEPRKLPKVNSYDAPTFTMAEPGT